LMLKVSAVERVLLKLFPGYSHLVIFGTGFLYNVIAKIEGVVATGVESARQETTEKVNKLD
jgi:hypothetical protein